MRFAFRTAASLIAGGFFLVSSFGASAQTQGSGPPAVQEEQQQSEAKPAEEQQADEATAEEQAAARAQAEIEQYRQAAARLSLTAGSAECVWTGRRIASLLWRDDMETALRYIGLYDRFGCSAEHLKLAFRCMVQQGPMDPKAADGLAARVHGCWLDPDGPTSSASKATEEPAQKNGTIPN